MGMAAGTAEEDGTEEDGTAVGMAAFTVGTARGTPMAIPTTIRTPIRTPIPTRIHPLSTRLLRFPSPANRSSPTGTTVRIQRPIIRT